MKIQTTSFEKFCLVACLGGIALLTIGSQAHAASINEIMIHPNSIKAQIVALGIIFVILKLLKPRSNAF